MAFALHASAGGGAHDGVVGRGALAFAGAGDVGHTLGVGELLGGLLRDGHVQDVEELIPRFRHNAAAGADRFGGELAGGDGVVATEDLDRADLAGEAGRVFVSVRFGAEAGECAGAETDLVGASGVPFPGARRREGLKVHGGPPVVNSRRRDPPGSRWWCDPAWRSGGGSGRSASG